MTYLIDTDLLSLLEKKSAPKRLVDWVEANGEGLFLSVVSLAEIEFGVCNAPASHQARLRSWLLEVRSAFSSATEELTEPVLVRWKNLLTELKKGNRTMTCEDSLIAATALYHGHTVVTGNVRHFAASSVATFNPLVDS